MSLAPGTRLGAYEISSLLGEGGMGQVYRARDTKLGRDVAIKVLPDAVATDPDRIARFEREAKTLAALNHPHIAHIYGLDRQDGRDGQEGHASSFIVMELVDGPTLADRIARGPIPLDEALPIAKQVALALEAAHEQGIVHRDLKPANIKVRPDGTVKLLDFGLAKALDPAAASGVGATMSPTLSIHATQAGLLLGTAAYMAPEQARGAPVDRRADVWAFGVVLYEMLTGRRLFAGDTISDTLAAVLRESIALDALPSATPPSVRRVLRRCLERDPKRRLRDIGDARLELDQNVAEECPVASTPGRSRGLALTLVVTAIVALGAIVVLAARRSTASAPPQYRFTIPVSRELPILPAGGPGFAVSPDGRWLIYRQPQGHRQAFAGPARLRSRARDGRRYGRTGAIRLSRSQWIGFAVGGRLLKKVPINGGIATTIGEIPGPSRGTWGDDGTIVFASNGRLYRISSGGGKAEAIPDKTPSGFWSEPVFLPGSAIVLVASGSPNQSTGQIFAVRVATGETVAITDGTSPRVVALDRIVFEQRGALWTARMDPGRLALLGSPAPLAEHVRLSGRFAFASASPTVLAFVPGTVIDAAGVVWIDRKGQTSPAIAEAGSFQQPRLSPDGHSIAVSVQSAAGADVWVYDLDRGTRLRLTTGGANRRPIWSADGKRIAFQNGAPLIVTMAADGSGTATPLINRTVAQFPDSWSSDGRLLLYNEGSQIRDIWVHAMDGRDKPDTPLVATRFSERSAMISPNVTWLAFVSDESGRDEVYVQPMAGGAKVAVSTAGGRQPLWSRSGRELFFRVDDMLMASDMSAPARPGAPVRLFEFPRALYGEDPNVVEYDVAADGRFLAVRRTAQSVDEIHVLTDWIR